jgi:dihydroorotate dehydrogenase (NAD+) catalytic subunit
MDISVDLAPQNKKGLRLANPVMTASGTFGYGTEFEGFIDIERLGAIVCKGIFLEPREGNPQPRIAETPSGMLNAIGLQGIGIKALIKEKAPVWAGWQVPVIVNIAGETVEEYARLAKQLDDVPGVSGLEVNISCPNIKSGGAEFGINPETAAEVTRVVRNSTSLPVLVKLTPNVTDIVSIAVAVARAGADALTLINTLKGMAIDIRKRKPVLGNGTGGLSGRAIKPVALQMVYRVAGAVDIPIIGCGGITNAQDALEFIMAGARAVQVGTASFNNPLAAVEVIDGIEAFLVEQKLTKITDIIGAARLK